MKRLRTEELANWTRPLALAAKWTCYWKRVSRAGFIDREFDEISERARYLDPGVVPINARKLSLATLKLCQQERQVVAVGNGSRDITCYWPEERQVAHLPVRTVRESRDRRQRQLEVDEVMLPPAARCFVDDVAVSGLTLAAARQALPARDDDMAVVGMAWKSRRLRRQAGMALQGAVIYRQEGGGTPAVNTLATLAAKPELRKDYAYRRFGNAAALEEIIAIYEQGDVE